MIGISDGVVGLVQNSRPMRNIFKREFSNKVSKLIFRFELKAMKFLESPLTSTYNVVLCSATRADELRCISWSTRIVGQTIPHPYEFMRLSRFSYDEFYIGVGCPADIPLKEVKIHHTGPIFPYIGSNTSEDTSMLKTWETELLHPLERKAFNLLRCIDWFVDRDTNLSSSINEQSHHSIWY